MSAAQNPATLSPTNMPATSEIHTEDVLGGAGGEKQKEEVQEKKKSSFGLFCDEEGYLNQIQYILQHGQRKGDRTGTGVVSVFGSQARYSLRGEQLWVYLSDKVFRPCTEDKAANIPY